MTGPLDGYSECTSAASAIVVNPPLVGLPPLSVICAAYTEVGGDEELPLGEEFQELMAWFKETDGDRHHYVEKLIRQLE